MAHLISDLQNLDDPTKTRLPFSSPTSSRPQWYQPQEMDAPAVVAFLLCDLHNVCEEFEDVSLCGIAARGHHGVVAARVDCCSGEGHEAVIKDMGIP